MRFLATLALAGLALCAPAPVLAGTFSVPFGGGTPMGAAGWVANAQAGALCRYARGRSIGSTASGSSRFTWGNSAKTSAILAGPRSSGERTPAAENRLRRATASSAHRPRFGRAGPGTRAVHEHAVPERHPAEPELLLHRPALKRTLAQRRVPSTSR